ncbi:uncharacterized protein [Setaria viridis]|uniref:uncharacterized protein n=1 Tax=Setaria viridis TaxID=4556 RepID=UPI003B3B6F72
MSSVPRELVEHSLELSKTARPVKQKLHSFTKDIKEAIRKAPRLYVSQCGIEANPVKVDAIRNMTKPSNKKDVMKRIGMMAALNRFISKLGEKGLPFFKLLKKADKFKWDNEASKTLEELKAFLTPLPS